jgi:RNA polymerase subunit RPABC4/transcription elongation factor Spt4
MSDLQTRLGGGLNKIQDSLQQGKQKLQTAQEISQYKKEIQDLSESRGDLILRLGEDTYRKIRTGEILDNHLREYFLSIAELDRKIFKAQNALEILSQKSETQTCTHCGAIIENGDKFCGSCGQKQEEKNVLTDQTQLAICPACEEQIPTTAKFCPCCGSRQVL